MLSINEPLFRFEPGQPLTGEDREGRIAEQSLQSGDATFYVRVTFMLNFVEPWRSKQIFRVRETFCVIIIS